MEFQNFEIENRVPIFHTVQRWGKVEGWL